MERLKDKVALITGASQGMGESHARVMVDEGAQVVLADIDDARGPALAEELGSSARFVRLDVTSWNDWVAAVAFTLSEFGSLDVLVNNAGIVNFGAIDEYELEQWAASLSVNLTGVFYGIKACAPALKLSGKGSIINVSSTAGLQGYESLPGYTASKFGVRGLTKSAALDLGKYNIRVNSVHPGAVRTPMTEPFEYPQEHVALHRVGEPMELSNLVLFLAADESSFCTGAEFIADGGETAGKAAFAHYD